MSGRTNNKALSIPNTSIFGLWHTVKVVEDRWDYILCRCKCGKEKEVNVYSLTSGKSKSCGCASLELRHKSQEKFNTNISIKSEQKSVREINKKRRGK